VLKEKLGTIQRGLEDKGRNEIERGMETESVL
jgi:hypothetical protein